MIKLKIKDNLEKLSWYNEHPKDIDSAVVWLSDDNQEIESITDYNSGEWFDGETGFFIDNIDWDDSNDCVDEEGEIWLTPWNDD